MKTVKGIHFLATGGVALAVAGATVLTPIVSAANPIDQTVNVTIGSAISLSINGNNAATGQISLSGDKALVPGSANIKDLKATARVISNDTNGYTLKMENTKDNASMTGAKAGSAIPTEAAEPTKNKAIWAYRTANVANNTWQAVPAKGHAATIAAHQGTSTTINGETYDVTFGVSATYITPADTYSSTVQYTAANNVPASL